MIHGLLTPFIVFLVLIYIKLIEEKKPKNSKAKDTTHTSRKFLSAIAEDNDMTKFKKYDPTRVQRTCQIAIPIMSGSFIFCFFFWTYWNSAF